MSQKPGPSPQGQPFPLPPQDQSEPSLRRKACLFPRFPDDLHSHPCSLFLIAQQLLCLAPAVLEGRDADLPAQMVALGLLLALHAGGSPAKPELPSNLTRWLQEIPEDPWALESLCSSGPRQA